jgi:transposase
MVERGCTMAQATRDLGREPYWRQVLARWRRSGLSVRAFCRAEGVSEPAFYWWRRRLDQVDHKKPAFLPVHVVADEARETATGGIEVVLANGRCLRVGPGFDPDTLVKVVDLLEAGEASC